MKKFLVCFLVIISVLSLMSIYIIKNKYDSVQILSVNKEYNLVINPKEEKVDIPLYFEKDNSFLTNTKTISSIFLEGDSAKLNVSKYEINKTEKIMYENTYYYEYIFSLSFSQYDSFNEPLEINNAKINIKYTNDVSLKLDIGNMNILFNSEIENRDLYIHKLSGIYNTINSKDILIGINLGIKVDESTPIIIKKISLKNSFYCLDYNYLEYEIKSFNYDIMSELEGYNIYKDEINENEVNIIINNKIIELFIPIRYLRLCEIDRLPLYIEYEKNNEKYIFIQDDFLFRSSNILINNNGINKYEYNYY